MDTVVLVVRDLLIPSGYSPNGDGVNDNFEIIGIDVYRDNEFTVFNRWGQVVYHAVGYANEWNGQGSNGAPLMDDTYFYVLKFNEDATYNGQVIIKR
jgi:gliding motility-associated-like protein